MANPFDLRKSDLGKLWASYVAVQLRTEQHATEHKIYAPGNSHPVPVDKVQAWAERELKEKEY